jgi:tetratricopeptide (TPR) repeat protein
MDQVFSDHRAGRSPLIMAVHGPGGVGKTTLALHWAHQVSDQFPEGQIYLNMRGYGPGEPVDPAVALDVVLRAAGVPETQVPRSIEERTALWRSTLFGRRMLILIDNVRDASQVRPLMPADGSVLVLVTSRNELRGLAVSDGARRLAVGVLATEEATALVGTVLGAERGEAEPDAILELVEQCGRLPLALVIAAERAASYPDAPLAELVADLRAGADRLDLLGNPADPAVDPRAVFSWSYRALTAEQARAFRRLGLHPTPEFCLLRASVLLRSSIPQTRVLLEALISVHLLELDQLGSYRFHDLLQVYAAERAAAEDSAEEITATTQRILDWYLHTVRNARAFTDVSLQIDPPADDFVQAGEFPDIVAANDWYLRRRSTLLAVIEHAAQHGFDRHCWQLAYLLRHFHESKRHHDDAMRAALLAMHSAERTGQDIALLHAKYTLGAASIIAGQPDTAGRLIGEVITLGEQMGAHAMVAGASVSIALEYAYSGEMESAVVRLEHAMRAAELSGDPAALAHVLLNFGAIQGMRGLEAESLVLSRQALALYRELNFAYFEAFALGNIAEAAYLIGEYDEALRCADEALVLLGSVEDQLTLPETLVMKGRVLTELGQHAAARQTWQRALAIWSSTEHPRAADVRQLLAGSEVAT